MDIDESRGNDVVLRIDDLFGSCDFKGADLHDLAVFDCNGTLEPWISCSVHDPTIGYHDVVFRFR